MTVEECQVGRDVWYQPSPGVRFRCIIAGLPSALGDGCTVALTLVDSPSYSAWAGRGQTCFYTTVFTGGSPKTGFTTLFLAEPLEPEEPVCIADNLCTVCKTFVCDTCRMLRPACCGASDDYPDSCDECANKKHAASLGMEICPGCKEMVDPTTCSCGAPKPPHGYCDNHGFIAMGCSCMRSREPLAQECVCGCMAIKHSSEDCKVAAHGRHRYKMKT